MNETVELLRAELEKPTMVFGDAPYEALYLKWLSADDKFRTGLRQAALGLLKQPLEENTFNELCRLIEVCGIQEAVPELVDMFREGASHPMLVIRTLLGLGWRGTLDFWLGQIDSPWPGLVFKGLSSHDPTLAFDTLPRLAPTEDALRDVLCFFPWVSKQVGATRLKEEARRVVGRLQPDVAELLQSWFVL